MPRYFNCFDNDDHGDNGNDGDDNGNDGDDYDNDDF